MCMIGLRFSSLRSLESQMTRLNNWVSFNLFRAKLPIMYCCNECDNFFLPSLTFATLSRKALHTTQFNNLLLSPWIFYAYQLLFIKLTQGSRWIRRSLDCFIIKSVSIIITISLDGNASRKQVICIKWPTYLLDLSITSLVTKIRYLIWGLIWRSMQKNFILYSSRYLPVLWNIGKRV